MSSDASAALQVGLRLGGANNAAASALLASFSAPSSEAAVLLPPPPPPLDNGVVSSNAAAAAAMLASFSGRFAGGASSETAVLQPQQVSGLQLAPKPPPPQEQEQRDRLPVRKFEDWRPEALLCRRFNVPDPYQVGGGLEGGRGVLQRCGKVRGVVFVEELLGIRHTRKTTLMRPFPSA